MGMVSRHTYTIKTYLSSTLRNSKLTPFSRDALVQAPIAHLLWSRFLRCNPKNSHWLNRDRFVLSNGHGCALQYTMLHLLGYDVTMDDLKAVSGEILVNGRPTGPALADTRPSMA